MKDTLVYVGLLWMTLNMILRVMMVLSMDIDIEKLRTNMMSKYFTVKVITAYGGARGLVTSQKKY